MALVVITVASVQAAAKKLGEPDGAEDQLDVAIRNSADKNTGGKITVPSQLAERVDALLSTAASTLLSEVPEEQDIVDPVASDDEPASTSPADFDSDEGSPELDD